MGSEEPMFPDARPVHKVYVDGFWMDRTTVTNRSISFGFNWQLGFPGSLRRGAYTVSFSDQKVVTAFKARKT